MSKRGSILDGLLKKAGINPGIPDATGPHGRGMGPGKGRVDGSGMVSTNPRILDAMKSIAGKNVKFGPESRLSEDLGLDSLDQYELLMRLEQSYPDAIPEGHGISEEDAAKWKTVGDISRYFANPQNIRHMKV